MKQLRLFIPLIIAVALPGLVLADGCPYGDGSWSSYTGMQPGRSVVSNCGGGGLQPGDLMSAASWDGVDVGAQWSVTDIELASVVIDDSGLNPDGSGVRVAHTIYTGGTFTLSPDGPWGHAPGSLDLIEGVMTSGTGTIQIFRIAGGITVDVISTINGTGTITSCGPDSDCVVSYAFGQSQIQWQGDPAAGGYWPDFPPFLLCAGSLPPLASQWNTPNVGFGLSCPISTDAITWGSLKGYYR